MRYTTRPLLEFVEHVAKVKNWTLGTASQYIFKDTKRYLSIRKNGSRPTHETLQGVAKWAEENGFTFNPADCYIIETTPPSKGDV